MASGGKELSTSLNGELVVADLVIGKDSQGHAWHVICTVVKWHVCGSASGLAMPCM